MFGSKLKYLILFICYFFIHYIEGFPPIGSLSIAQLWKIPLLLYLLVYNILFVKNRPIFEKTGYWLSIEYFFSLETVIKPLNVIIRVSKQLPFILFLGFWRRAFAEKKDVLIKILYGLAQFICLASLPVLLGIIQPLQGEMSAESFGIEGLIYFSSIFGAPHAAASYFCGAVLVLINGFFSNRFTTQISKLFNGILVIIGLISLFKAYVRTGWLMFLVGLCCIPNFKIMTKRKLIIVFCSIIMVICGLSYLYNNNEAFYARITGRNIYTGTGGTNLEINGSGRTAFWSNAVKGLWDTDNIYYFLFGRGFTKVTEDNLHYTGMEVFSHNQFLDALSQNGFIGFVLLIMFFFYLYRYIKKRNGSHKKLCYALYWSSFIFAFFQNEMYFDFAILFSLSVAILTLEDENYCVT